MKKRLALLLCCCLFFSIMSGCTSSTQEREVVSADKEAASSQNADTPGSMPSASAAGTEGAKPQQITAKELGEFNKGVHFRNEPDRKDNYPDIIKLFQSTLAAWADKDEPQFRKAFQTEKAADAHLYLIQNPVDYEFVGTPFIDDQSSDTGRVNIYFQYRTSKAPNEITGMAATFEQHQANGWKLVLID